MSKFEKRVLSRILDNTNQITSLIKLLDADLERITESERWTKEIDDSFLVELNSRVLQLRQAKSALVSKIKEILNNDTGS